jgi:hypothetical protein
MHACVTHQESGGAKSVASVTAGLVKASASSSVHRVNSKARQGA